MQRARMNGELGSEVKQTCGVDRGGERQTNEQVHVTGEAENQRIRKQKQNKQNEKASRSIDIDCFLFLADCLVVRS